MDFASTCPDCGAPVPGGRAGCRAIFEELGSDAAEGAVPYWLHRLAVDAYALQHPEPFCRSAKSLAAHLGGLCCAIEHAGNPAVHRSLQRWLSGPARLEKPELPASRAGLTIADIRGARGPAEIDSRIRLWARAVWRAWRPHHELARRWVALACESGKRRTRNPGR